MKPIRNILATGLVIVFVLFNCERTMELQRADVNHVQNQLAKFAPVQISYDKSILSERDQQVVMKLVSAAKLIDQIFLRQVYTNNEAILKALVSSKRPEDKVYLDYFKIMYGPFDRLDENKPFLITSPKPLGANYYPEDLTKSAFLEWVANHPEDKSAFESNFTIIRRSGERLVAIPYAKAYADLLGPAARLLREAAALAENASLKRFLTSRADAFLTNDYYQSDMDWMDLDSPIEVVIGPYEVYEDALLGYKAAFESFITVVDPVESQKLVTIGRYLNSMERNLPYPDQYKNFERGQSSPFKVVQEIYTAGDTRAGTQTIAFNLPNDERVREAKGSKKVMLKNIMEAKFNKILMPIAERVIVSDQLPNISFDAYFNHVLLHEVSHGLGPGMLTLPTGEKTTVNKMLAETYSTIEEAKADVCGNYNVQFLIDQGVFPKELESSLYVTYLAGMFRSVRFGINSAHARANMIQFNYLSANDAVQFDDQTQKFRVNQDQIKPAIRSLANQLLMIQAKGDYQGAKNLIEQYSAMNPSMQAALAKLGDIPVDIKPIYEIEAGQ